MEKWKIKSNKRRFGIIGFTFVIIMAWVISASVSFNAEAGCDGDCMSCHPSLKGSKEHSSLTSCIACHNPANKKPKLFNHTTLDSGCGTRCFLCHNEWPVDAYHAPLNTCLECHDK